VECPHCLKEGVRVPMKLEKGFYACRRCPCKIPLPPDQSREQIRQEKLEKLKHLQLELDSVIDEIIDCLE